MAIFKHPPPAINPQTSQYDVIYPEWLRIPGAINYSGLKRSTLFTLISEKRIASKLVKTHPSNVGGIRLIELASLRAFIQESGDE